MTTRTINLLYSLPRVLQELVYEFDDTYKGKTYERIIEFIRTDGFQMARSFGAFARSPELFERQFRSLLSLAMMNYEYLSMDWSIEPDDWSNGLVSHSRDWRPRFSRVNRELVLFKLLPVSDAGTSDDSDYDGFMSLYEPDKSPLPDAQYFGHCLWFKVYNN
jgi:hypothetical protein